MFAFVKQGISVPYDYGVNMIYFKVLPPRCGISITCKLECIKLHIVVRGIGPGTIMQGIPAWSERLSAVAPMLQLEPADPCPNPASGCSCSVTVHIPISFVLSSHTYCNIILYPFTDPFQ